MSTSGGHRRTGGASAPNAATDIDESPTHLVQQLLMRDSPNPSAAIEGEAYSTTTLTVMVRLQPPPRSLLVVDTEFCRRLHAALTDAGFESLIATTTQQALDGVSVTTPSLVVTDRLDVVRRFRALESRRMLQILLLADQREWDAGHDAGADDCIEFDAPVARLRARLTIARRMADLESALRASLVEGRRLATMDELTNVSNRRFFATHYPREVARSARYGRAITVAMCDIDHFKLVNDQHGHAAGDDVLRQCAHRIQQCLRQGSDWVARLGGDEFAIVLPETDLDAALVVCRKVQLAISSQPIRCGTLALSVTASVGVAGLVRVPTRFKGQAERLLSVADRALYRAKATGRSRVVGARVSPATL